jgi:hypothetical protein
MKYIRKELCETDLLEITSLSEMEIARRVGCDHSYISLLKSGKRIATYDFYLRLRTAVLPTLEESA